MRKLDVWEINHLESKQGLTIDSTTAEDDEDDGEGAKVLVPS